MIQLTLMGLDAQNPLGFFAALGLLRVIDLHAARHGASTPSLSFKSEGRQVAELWSALSYDEVVSVVLEDAAAQSENLALRLAYDDDGRRCAPDAAGARRDLKPSPAVAREYLEELARGDRRAADLGSAFFCELVQDNKGNTKPSAFHFTAGQQAFLSMVEELRRGLTVDGLQESLLGPWHNKSSLPSLSWDSSITRLYALRAGDPSKERRGSVPAANWLGVQGLSFFPVNAQGRFRRLVTTGVKGGWKDAELTWPIWDVPISVAPVASLLRLDPRTWTARERSALGVSGVFASKILRSDQGGYGSFSPAEIVLPTRAQ
jgi:hypothetical protein